jgi:hypothetical protein
MPEPQDRLPPALLAALDAAAGSAALAWFEPDRVLIARPPASGTFEGLAVGPKAIARLFRRDPPAPVELERAIDVSEDEIMRMAPTVGPAGSLTLAGPALGAWADRLAPSCSRAVLEDHFTHLAAAAEGRPGAAAGLPPGSEAAAVLLVVRELVHHLGMDGVTVL